MRPFNVRIQGAFYHNHLYGERGEEIFDLDAACAAADRQFPDWVEVFNGQEGVTREEWLGRGLVQPSPVLQGGRQEPQSQESQNGTDDR